MRKLNVLCFLALNLALIPLQARAEGPLPPIVRTESVVGEINWQSMKDKLTELLFNSTQDISSNILNVSGIKLNLRLGRALLDSDDNRYSLLDHIGTTLSYGRADNALSIGGSAGFSIYFIRPIQTPQQSLSVPPLVDMPPTPGRDGSNALADPAIQDVYNDENLIPIYAALQEEIQSGNSSLGGQLFQAPDLPIAKYLDLLASLKLPSRMPWTSKDLMNPKKFQPGDIASYNVNGGIWANLGGTVSNAYVSAGASIGAFLQGHYRITLLKEAGSNVLMEVVFEKDEGLQYMPLEIRLGVTIGTGIAIIKGKNLSFSPLKITGQNYRSSIFSHAFRLDLSSQTARDAFDAAIHGNLMRAQNEAAKEADDSNPVVADVSDSVLGGAYDNLQTKVDVGLIKIEDDRDKTVEKLDFRDARGSFERELVSFSDITNIDTTLWKGKDQTTQAALATFYAKSPEGPFAPQLQWMMEDVNYYPNKTSYQTFLRKAAETIGSSPWSAAYSTRKPTGLQRMALHIQFSSKIYPLLASLSESQIWAAFEKLAGVKAGTWGKEFMRNQWLQDHGLDPFPIAAMDGAPYTGEELLSLFEDMIEAFQAMKKQSTLDQVKALIALDQETGDLPILPRTLIELCGDENAYIRFENEGSDLPKPVLLIVNPEAQETINYPSPYDWMTLPNYGLE